MKEKFYYFDIFVIILNLAAGRGNVLPYLLFSQLSSLRVLFIVFVINILYLILRFRFFSNPIRINKQFRPFFVVFCLLFLNFFNCVISPGEDYISVLLLIGVVVTFFSILHRIAFLYRTDNNYIFILTKGYIYLSALSVFGMILSFVLLNLGFKSEIKVPQYDFLIPNIESGVDYTISFFSMVDGSIARLPFFQEYGILTGLYHEPNALTYGVFPAFFLASFFCKKQWQRIMLISCALIVILLSASATNIFVLCICLAVYYIFNFRKHFFQASIAVLLVIFVAYFYFNTDDTLLEFLIGRTESGNISQEHSRKLLEFMFIPRTLLGTNFFSTKFVLKESFTENIGYIPFVLNTIVLFGYLKNTYSLLKENSKFSFSIGMASLYFFLHSLKVGMTLYQQNIFYFLLFIQILYLSKYGRVGDSRESVQN